jgi:quercetin dioxygenase-like cupin family protein
MTDALQETQHRRTHPLPMAAAFLEFDLAKELAGLRAEPEWQSGQNAKTLVKYDDFRIVLTALKAKANIPSHQTDGRLSIHVITGHVQMRALGRTFDLAAGSLVGLDRGIAHEISALEESALLLTIAWPVGTHRT